jgi:hypothetical protein
MTFALSFIGIAILVGVVIVFTRTRVPHEAVVTVAQIGRVFESLSAAPPGVAFAVISFTTPERPAPKDALDVQFFKENGRIGFDWPLTAPRNVEDEERFLSFARESGFAPRSLETNGVRYHRVDEGDVLQLCLRVITELYGRPPETQIELIIEGFDVHI